MNIFTKLCRLCASSKDVSITLNNYDTDQLTFANKLNDLAPEILDESNNELPNGICEACIILLNDAYKFKRKCFASQAYLKQYLKQMHNGIETKEFEFVNVENVGINIKEEIDEKSEINLCESSYFHSETKEVIDNFIAVKSEVIEEEFCDEKKQKHVCKTCNKSFQSIQSLLKHNRAHTTSKCYKCNICDKVFKANQHLIRHTRTHTREKPFICEICEKAYSDPSTLRRHFRTHTAEKPYKCEICDKAYHRNEHLKVHIRTHTQERPYKCGWCTKAFYRSEHLKTHIRIHTQERPHSCDICGRAFTVKSDLTKHIRRHYKANYI